MPALQLNVLEQDILREKCVPWEDNRYKLVSWWVMKPFPVARLLWLVRNFQEAVSDPAQSRDDMLDEDAKGKGSGALSRIIAECEDCSLLNAADQFRRIKEAVSYGCTHRELNAHFPEAMNRIEDECKRRVIMAIEPDHVKYFSNAQFFDSTDADTNKVSTEFPSANEDIGEAGKCLACGRGTACVMHLNRITEVGLRALANDLGVPSQNDWGKYLEEIGKALQKKYESAGARTVDEQFYSEARITFDSMRRAWRNPSMHIEKTYTVERAEEILVAVRSFMRHLATRLHE